MKYDACDFPTVLTVAKESLTRGKPPTERRALHSKLQAVAAEVDAHRGHPHARRNWGLFIQMFRFRIRANRPLHERYPGETADWCRELDSFAHAVHIVRGGNT